MPNTHRRRRRDSTVVELCCVSVGGVYTNLQLAHDNCRPIRSTIWKLNMLKIYPVGSVINIDRPKLYCDLETGVRGYSRSSKMALFDRAHTTLYSSSIVTICLYLLPFPRYCRILVENRYLLLVFGAPIGGEAIRFTQRPLVTKNLNDGPVRD